MRAWQFSRPKGPGFGISGSYFLSVLSSRAPLPSILQLVNPGGEAGAVVGFGVPLVSDKDKSLLGRPLERGAYAIATKDRKTVLRLLVISKEEAGFDAEAYLRSQYAADANPELVARMRGTWQLLQFMFESHDPAVYPSLDFLQQVVVHAARLTEGVIADPVSQRYLLPDELIQSPRIDPKIDSREHVVVHFRTQKEGMYAYTFGMQKFDLPEFEIAGIDDSVRLIATRFLLVLCQTVLLGNAVKSGDSFGSDRAPLQIREGGFDRAVWEGIDVFELLPPTTLTSSECLVLWNAEVASPS